MREHLEAFMQAVVVSKDDDIAKIAIHEYLSAKMKHRFNPITEADDVDDIKSIDLNAAKWQDSNGNTYHTVVILLNGKHFDTVRNQYGYGRAYEQTALATLIDKGKIPKDVKTLSAYAYDNKIDFDTNETDVPRKKDMVNW